MSVPHVRPLHLPRLSLSSTSQLVVVEEDEEQRANGRPDRTEAQAEECCLVAAGLRRESIPKHVAVIMDGNRRWAQLRGLPASSGYEAGVRSLRLMVELCCKLGIGVLTVFAFSTDNWLRPKVSVILLVFLLLLFFPIYYYIKIINLRIRERNPCFRIPIMQVEIEFLMSLFERGVREELESFLRYQFANAIVLNSRFSFCHFSFNKISTYYREKIRISIIGNTSRLPNSLQKLIANVEETTKNSSGLQLIVAVSYSGQYDIVQACQRIAMKVKDGVIAPDDVNESLIEQELETNCIQFPYPDLLIRTSGELRISNFLLWQLAYTELFFAKSLWPDFGEIEFLEALHDFQRRQRRYGGSSFE